MCSHPVRGRQCHCAAEGCHRTFTSLSAFDRHQRWMNGTLLCIDPETAVNAKGELVFSLCGRGWSLAAPENPFWRISEH